MDKSFLRPPNSQHLSDEVIGDVVENKRPSHYIPTTERSTNSSTYHSDRSLQSSEYSEHILARNLASTYIQDTNSETKEEKAAELPPLPGTTVQHSVGTPRTDFLPRDVQDVHDTYAVDSDTRHTESSTQETPIAATIQVLIAEKERIRALRRERQIRYRKKKHDYMLSLEDETKNLREEIKDLQQRRESLCAVLPKQSSIWTVVVEYFRLFEHGLHTNAQVSVTSPPSWSAWSDAQLDFVRATISPNVAFNSEQGVEAMIRNWQDLSQWFQDVHVELEELEKSVEGSVIATTRTSVTISEQTLRYVFPHLCGSNNASQARYVRQLVGQRFIMPGLTRFKWDGANQCVSSVTAQSDMLAPMLRVLGTLEDISNVFKLSRISLDFQWRRN